MGKQIFVLLCSLLFVFNMSAQTQVTVTKTLESYAHQIEKSGTSYSTGANGIGFEVSTGKTFRSYYIFDLTELTAAETIEEVKLNYYTSHDRSFTLKVTELASDPGTDYQAGYTSIGNSTARHTGLQYETVTVVVPSTSLKTSIQGKLSGGKLVLGALSETESGSSDTYTNVTLSLTVKYKRPASNVNLEARNDMDGYTGGEIKVGWGSTLKQTWTSPKFFEPLENESFSLEAIDNQSYSGYNYVFNDSEAPANKSKWFIKISGAQTELSTGSSQYNSNATSSINNATFITKLRKVCNVAFYNTFDNHTNEVGQIIVNSTPRTAPYTENVVEQNSVTFTAMQNYTPSDNVGIEYNFKYWKSNGVWVSSNLTKTLDISDHKPLTAEYEARALFNNSNYRNLTTNSSYRNIGDPIVLNWSDHPNTLVTYYRVYRKYHDRKFNITEPETLMAQLPRGTTTWTDYDFIVGNSSSEYTLQYDVRAYYAPAGNYSSIAWLGIMGDLDGAASKEMAAQDKNTIVEDYAINNYPNPFNPTTTINYQLPEQGHVTIKVYDMLGKEVAELVNEVKESGIYNADFDASDLSTGVYVYMIKVDAMNENSTGYVMSKKMLLMK